MLRKKNSRQHVLCCSCTVAGCWHFHTADDAQRHEKYSVNNQLFEAQSIIPQKEINKIFSCNLIDDILMHCFNE